MAYLGSFFFSAFCIWFFCTSRILCVDVFYELISDETNIGPSNVPLQREVRQATGNEKSQDLRPAKILSETTTTVNPKDEDYSDYGITLPPGESKVLHNHHFYYNSTIYMEKEKWLEFWVDMDSLKERAIQTVLSNAYRKGITLTLSFEFPFYGHLLRNITVTTGGFLFTGAQVHSWLAATQYIAPLMANFDPSLMNESVVKYADNGTAFTVQWENMQLKDKKYAGNFTFQVTLLNTGDIIFVYIEVPVSVMQINEDEHPVKIGISDAYIIDKTVFFVRRKTIYEYHRIDLRKPGISNTTSIYITALPTCISLKDCQSCMTVDIAFDCVWCNGRCSDGMDRDRHNWLMEGCGTRTGPIVCPEMNKSTTHPLAMLTTESQGTGDISSEALTTLTPGSSFTTSFGLPVNMTFLISNVSISTTLIPENSSAEGNVASEYNYPEAAKYSSLNTAGVVVVLFVVSIVLAFIGWIFYAYKYPQTTSGQILIKYRPSQWSLPKGEARYTAAPVHM